MTPLFLALIILSGIVGSVAFLLIGKEKPLEEKDALNAADFEISESNDRN